MIPGHETIGNVVAVGPGEKLWKIGDRVGAPWHGGHDGISNPITSWWMSRVDEELDSNMQVLQARPLPDVWQRADQRCNP